MAKHAIIKADCFDVLSNLPQESIDIVFADLPFNRTNQSWDKMPFDVAKFNRVLWPKMKEDAVLVMTADDTFSGRLQADVANFKYKWYWIKNKSTGHLNAKKRPMQNVEEVLVFYKRLPPYNPVMTYGHEPMNNANRKKDPSSLYGAQVSHSNARVGATTRYPTRDLQIDVVNNDDPKRIHANQKPLTLIEYLLKTYLKPDSLIFDPTAGSFTTTEAAMSLKLNSIAVELDQDPENPNLCQRALQRLHADYPHENLSFMENPNHIRDFLKEDNHALVPEPSSPVIGNLHHA